MQTKAVITHITNWIIKYINSCPAKGFVIGISGGIDSAVTSVLAAKTELPVICVDMPIHQNKKEVERGKKHVEWLSEKFSNVSSNTIELTSTFDNFIKELPYNKNMLSLANTRSRLRMTTLYYLAQENNYLVLGTGNKVEDFGIGFFTKYGDGGVDISPIADLVKSEIYSLAKELNINNDIINALPTDGLWDDHKTDEEQIGATYPELEWAMKFKGDKEKLLQREKEVLNIYKNLNYINQHKMLKIPVCIIPENLK